MTADTLTDLPTRSSAHTPAEPVQVDPHTTAHNAGNPKISRATAANNPSAPPHPPASAATGADPSSGLTFAQLHLARPVLSAVTEEGYTHPTPIQAKAIPPVLAGRDVLGSAQTGTGKTAAFALPVLSRLLTTPEPSGQPPISSAKPHYPRVLVLSPTRELAAQIADSFRTYGRHTRLRQTVIFGGVGQGAQVKALRAGVDILIATPGRLEDLKQQGHVNLSQVQILILDEADRMLDMGFIIPIKRICAALPTSRQTLLFSATMPREVQHLADALMREPVRVAVNPVASLAPKIEQFLYHVPKKQKPSLLLHLLSDPAASRVVVFSKTKHGADRIAEKLERNDVTAAAIHGNKAQNQRTRALAAFATGRCRVLVATDVAARGLDIDDVTHVINFDLPMEAEAYVHRIGRTGRAGATGIAIAFCDADERGLLSQIERLTKTRIPVRPLPQNLPRTEPTDAELAYRAEFEGMQGKAPHKRPGYFQDQQPFDGQQRPDRAPGRGPNRGADRGPGRGAGRGSMRSPVPDFDNSAPAQDRPSRPPVQGWSDRPRPDNRDNRDDRRHDQPRPQQDDAQGAERFTRESLGLPPKPNQFAPRGPRAPRPAKPGFGNQRPTGGNTGGFGGASRANNRGPGGPSRGPSRGPSGGPGSFRGKPKRGSR
jgi:ATP-dependent RNA helicase RhlE